MPKVPSEVTYEQYVLRATFFYNRLKLLNYFDIYENVKNLHEKQGNAFAWDERIDWGISSGAWEIIKETGVPALHIFCHPKALQIHPALLRYYRSIALLPVKGLKAISSVSNIENIESGKRTLTPDKLLTVTRKINEICSFVIERSVDFEEEQLRAMLYATAGSGIDGSWRNAIGAEGERIVRSMIIDALSKFDELTAFSYKNDRTESIVGSNVKHILEDMLNIKSITTKNGYTIFFSSEPDIQLIDPNNNTVGAIEVKAGIDPAGALERLGAMFKSFDNIRSRYNSATTILVASCITDEVQSRLQENRTVDSLFILTDLIKNAKGKTDMFINKVRHALGLIQAKRL